MAAAASLIGLAAIVGGPLSRLDVMVSSAVHVHVGDPVVAAGYAITLLGGTDAVLPVTAACAAGLLAMRLWHSALALVAAVVLTQLVVQVAKGLVERSRPPANASVAEAGGFSFPSGHSATSAALFGLLALVAARHLQGRARLLVAGAGVALFLVVGASRVVLSAHYPTDVVAGWLTGGAIALGCLALFTRARDGLARGAPTA